MRVHLKHCLHVGQAPPGRLNRAVPGYGRIISLLGGAVPQPFTGFWD